MMDYGSWLHHGALDNHQYYNRCGLESPLLIAAPTEHQPRDDDNEQNIDETTNETNAEQSANSYDRSSSADIFRLEFAATQWSKLVTNAEGLFNKLMIKNLLPHNEQDQIEQWLCLKQEYEECITSDETASLQGYQENTKRSLEIIEEVTETDERTEESDNIARLRNKTRSSSTNSEMSEDEDEDDEEEEEDEDEEEEYEEEDRSEASSSNPDFLEKLDEFMNKFKNQTDSVIDAKKYEINETNFSPLSTITKITDSKNFYNKNHKNNPINNNNKNNNNNNNYVPIIRPVPIRNPNSRRNSMLPGSEMCNEIAALTGNFRPLRNRNHEMATEARDFRTTPVSSVRTVESSDNYSPGYNLDCGKITEIRETVGSPKSSPEANFASATRVGQKYTDLECAQRRIAELQNIIGTKELMIEEMRKNNICDWRENPCDAEERHAAVEEDEESKEEDKQRGRLKSKGYEKMALDYEKRLRDMETMSQIADDTARKVQELETSLGASRKQMDRLKRQLRREEESKRQLELELLEDQTRIRDLEVKYSLTASKLRELRQSEFCDSRISRDNNVAAAINYEGNERKSLSEVSARITQLDRVLREKSMNLELITDNDEREALRREIQSLRTTRECLIEEKCALDDKLQKHRSLSFLEERKLLICGEAIEAIDAIIEEKNVIICGNGTNSDEVREKRRCEKSELLRQLEKLPDGEMCTLFDKYFRKVIELKQNSRSLDEQIGELERQVEWKERGMRLLGETLRRSELETERRIFELQSEIGRLKRDDKILRRKLAEYEARQETTTTTTTRTTAAAATATRSNVSSPPRIVQRELKKIAPKTKVTRERNKLIIQRTMDSDGRKK